MGLSFRGLRDDPESPKHWSFEQRLLPVLPVKYPTNVDLREFSSPRQHQGDTSSCVAQAVCKSLEILKIQAEGHGAHRDLSRLAVYWQARNLMFPKETMIDNGTYIGHAFDAIRRYGVPSEQTWPWDPAKVCEAPSWTAMREAYTNKIHSFYRIQATGAGRIPQVLSALRAGLPVVFGTRVDTQWSWYSSQAQPLRPVVGEALGRHATVLVGYQDGLFIGENSWGEGWGHAGFYFMEPSVIAHSDSRDFWVPRLGEAL